MRPGVLGGLGYLLVVPVLYLAAFDWLTVRKLRDSWRGSDALNGELDESLACDLAKDFVKLNGDSYSKVLCKGELVVSGDVARLTNVQANWNPHTFCFARTPRWQVLRSDEGVPCFGSPPPDLSRPLESEHERVMEAAITLLNDRLAGVRRAMESAERPEKCTAHRRSTRGDVPLLEFELLQGQGAESWSFLSTPWLREAVVKGDEASLLSVAQHWRELRPWVAVVTSAARVEPHGGSLITPWKHGSLMGTMTLVDAEAGTLLCEVPFTFESSATIERPPSPSKYGKSRINIEPIQTVQTDAEVRADLQRRYESAATRTINLMTTYDAWPSFH